MREVSAVTKLMVLGAGLFQLSGITRAVELGLEVVTVDNVPSNPGHRFGHRSVNRSTTDVDGVVEVASEFGIDGIVTFSSDVAVESVAAVTEKLDLPGPSREAVRSLSNKARFRVLQREHGIDHPAFEVIRDATAPAGGRLSRRGTVVVKPADSSGSRGVTVVRPPRDQALLGAIANARNYARSGCVIVEEFLNGTEVGGDAFLRDGRIACLFVTEKRLDGVLVSGHCYPNRSITRETVDAIRSTLERCCAAAGLTDGPLNFDVMVDSGIATVIEMSPRTGGNGIPQVIREIAGVDVEELSVHFSVGDRLNLDRRLSTSPPVGSGVRAISHVLTASSGGRIESVVDGVKLASRDPRIKEAWVGKSAGEHLAVRGTRSEPFGYLILRLEADDEPTESIVEAANWIRLHEPAEVRGEVAG